MATSLQGTDDGVGFGVKGEAPGLGDGVVGTTKGPHKAGVRGVSTAHISAIAVIGELQKGTAAVKGLTGGSSGVGGDEPIGSGVWGDSSRGPGISGTSSVMAGVVGVGPIGVRGIAAGGTLAGLFEGDVQVSRNVIVTGDVLLSGADLAEQFEIVGERTAEPGCVVVLAGQDAVRVSEQPYDHRVAGVISGAGSYRAAVILDRRESTNRQALALSGKTWCKVDADHGAIKLGDLLTTSPTPGHAMRAEQKDQAFGAVLGKALGDFPSGRGILPILVALQ
jgi:hypothetical protein